MAQRSASLVWLFDLDNTLHDARPHIFPHINRAMVEYIRDHLGVDENEATRIRQHYWQRYGATLLGLMRHHGTDPRHFLWHTHQFPALAQMLRSDRALRHSLLRLPGQKILFTNGPNHYAEAVLRQLRIADLFADVISLQSIDYRPKPDPHGFRYILRKHKLSPASCVMVEDSAENLFTAKRLGMRTVWITASHGRPAYIDWRIRKIAELARIVGQLR